MREPNFKLGWYIPQHIAALTHFHPDVTADDFMGVVQTGQELLENVDNEFHVLIDNRRVAMQAPASLSQMKQMVPYMTHPLLRWVVVVKPAALNLDTSQLAIEQEGQTQLKNVASLAEAFAFLRQVVDEVHWHQADTTLFPNTTH
jgi:hypothetical protein